MPTWLRGGLSKVVRRQKHLSSSYSCCIIMLKCRKVRPIISMTSDASCDVRYHVPCSWLRQKGNLLVVFEEQGGDPTGVSLLRRTIQRNSWSFGAREKKKRGKRKDHVMEWNFSMAHIFWPQRWAERQTFMNALLKSSNLFWKLMGTLRYLETMALWLFLQ